MCYECFCDTRLFEISLLYALQFLSVCYKIGVLVQRIFYMLTHHFHAEIVLAPPPFTTARILCWEIGSGELFCKSFGVKSNIFIEALSVYFFHVAPTCVLYFSFLLIVPFL